MKKTYNREKRSSNELKKNIDKGKEVGCGAGSVIINQKKNKPETIKTNNQVEKLYNTHNTSSTTRELSKKQISRTNTTNNKDKI